jgi:hypothetical protein
MQTQSQNAPGLPVLEMQQKVVMETATPVDVSDEKVEEASSGPSAFLQAMQTVLDEMKLNSREGVARLAGMDPSDKELKDLAHKLALMLGVSLEEAMEQIKEWQIAQKDVQEQIEEQEKEIELAKAQKRKAWLPIWRCAACGRADKPWIACHVKPFIVRYDSVDVESGPVGP